MVNDTEHKMATVHEVKIWPEFFMDVADNKKPIELRLNDRDYQAGDLIQFLEWSPITETFTGRMVTKGIDYVLAFADLSGEIKSQLGINPSPSSLNKLVILKLSEI